MRRKTTRKRKVLIKDHGDGLEFVSVTGGQASAPPSDESPEVKARRLQVALVNAEQNFMKCATERDQHQAPVAQVDASPLQGQHQL